jgi:hypothetical protein
MKSDITNNISDIDQQKRNCLSDISDMRKSLNDHLDKIEKQTVEEIVSVEHNLQVQLKNVLVAMEAKKTDFDVFEISFYVHNGRRCLDIFCYLKNGT